MLYRLGKWLFPKDPRMVRYRKLHLLFFTVFSCLLIALAVGLMLFFANRFSFDR